MGDSLQSLCISASSTLLRSASQRALWIAPRLKYLALYYCDFPIDLDDFNAGVKELKCAMLTSHCPVR